MPFKPVKQLNTILKQQYFEPTITWSLRVVLALNIPLIVIPFYKGFSYEVIWAAFGAYMLSLIDYRGLHYKKITIQFITALLSVTGAIAGMYVTRSVAWSVAAMFVIGLCVAIIRNWKDYGPSIAVSMGFFFLFGLATPVSFEDSLIYGAYLLVGCAWAIIITLFSFPFQPSSPMRRSVAKIWKANTDLLDVIIQKLISDEEVNLHTITEKELAVRNVINESRNLFANRENKNTSLKTQHYDQVIALRQTASLFGATLGSMHEELEIINTRSFRTHPDISFYKTLSAFAQASARVSIVIFTFRADDFSLAKIRVKRCEVAVALFEEAVSKSNNGVNEDKAIRHFITTLHHALGYLQQSLVQIEEKLRIEKSDYLENYKLSFHEFISGLKPQLFGGFISKLFSITAQQLQYALRVAIGLSLGVFIFKYFKIDHGNWIPLTMMIVIQPYYGATLKKGLERIAGTVAGIVVGGLILLLPIKHEALIIFLAIDSFFVAYFLRNNYKVGVFFVTIMMVLMMHISQQSNWHLIGWRIVSTLIGALLALISGYAFWPVWEKKRFPALLANALTQNKKYLLQVIQYAAKQLPAGESWYRRRRLAEGANSDVFSSVQRMLQEPGYARQNADESFALVGTNIRISREITSVALNLDKTKTVIPAGTLNDFSKEVVLIFDSLTLYAADSDEKHELPGFKALKETLSAAAFDQDEQLKFLRSEFEKIVFELEAICVLMSKNKAVVA